MSSTTTIRQGSRRLWSITLAAILASLLLVAVVAAGAATLVTPTVAQTQVSMPADGANQASVSIAMRSGVLYLGALPPGDTLLSGALAHPPREEIEQSVEHSQASATAVLRSRAGHPSWPAGWLLPVEKLRWELGLSRALPLELNVEVAVGDAQLDLAELQVERLEVKGGIGATTITLPRRGRLRAEITGGDGHTVITIPTGVAARIEARAGVGPVTLLVDGQPRRLPYTSPDYASAANRVSLNVTGSGGTTVVRAGESGTQK